MNKILEYLRANKLLRQGLIDTNYYFLAQVGSRIVGLLVIPVFTRALTIEDFASYDLFVLGSSFLVLLAGLGMDSGSSIKISESKNDISFLRGILFTSLSMNFFAILLLWLLSLAVWYIGFLNQIDQFFIHGLFLYTLLYQFSYTIYNFTRWMGNAKNAALVNFTSYLLGVGGGLAGVLLFKASIGHYIVGAIAGSLLGAVVSAVQVKRFLAVQLLPRDQFYDLMRLSLPYIPTYLSNYLMQFIDRVLITSFFGLPTLGLYALVNRMGQVVTFGLQVISSGFRPIITANYNRDEGQLLSRRIFNFYWIAALPVSISSIVSAPFFIYAFGGEQYRNAIPILPYVIVSVWFLGSFFLFGFGYQIKRKTFYVTIITFGVVALAYSLSIVLVRYFGMLGIAQATSISAGVGSWIYIYVSERLYRFQYALRTMIICSSISLMIVFLFS